MGSIIRDLVVICDEIMEAVKIVLTKTIPAKTISAKTIPANHNEKTVTCKTENFYIISTLLLITITLLIINL